MLLLATFCTREQPSTCKYRSTQLAASYVQGAGCVFRASDGMVTRDPQLKWAPLHHAACNGHIDMVHALLSAGAWVDLPDSVRAPFTDTHFHTFPGLEHADEHSSCHLIPSCCAPQDGWTALHLAACGGHVNVVATLVGSGAGHNVRTQVCVSIRPCSSIDCVVWVPRCVVVCALLTPQHVLSAGFPHATSLSSGDGSSWCDCLLGCGGGDWLWERGRWHR